MVVKFLESSHVTRFYFPFSPFPVIMRANQRLPLPSYGRASNSKVSEGEFVTRPAKRRLNKIPNNEFLEYGLNNATFPNYIYFHSWLKNNVFLFINFSSLLLIQDYPSVDFKIFLVLKNLNCFEKIKKIVVALILKVKIRNIFLVYLKFSSRLQLSLGLIFEVFTCRISERI